uniref:Uncharacterized protein n=1 Tax=Strombidium inclinatum TaxID=197538 RepID=A0A7S3IDC3_9SPIT|mmetsp:Transcript_10365/g.15948  ORF Transcript_10365/g.15948 Transcript_10365/m.15948 type:complete len:225 (+) Transcript_10365:4105-4779(+)
MAVRHNVFGFAVAQAEEVVVLLFHAFAHLLLQVTDRLRPLDIHKDELRRIEHPVGFQLVVVVLLATADEFLIVVLAAVGPRGLGKTRLRVIGFLVYVLALQSVEFEQAFVLPELEDVRLHEVALRFTVLPRRAPPGSLRQVHALFIMRETPPEAFLHLNERAARYLRLRHPPLNLRHLVIILVQAEVRELARRSSPRFLGRVHRVSSALSVRVDLGFGQGRFYF